MKTKKLLYGDCRKFMFDGTIEPESIDLTVTSPPYDNLRTYNNSSTWGWAEFCGVASGLWLVTKAGGVVVWVVNDATIKGSETGTSFEQALAFKKMGFNLHDTMIYYKSNAMPLTHNRYDPAFEYMFVFSKEKPKTFNALKEHTKTEGNKINRARGTKLGFIKTHQSRCRNEITTVKSLKYRKNVWQYPVGVEKNKSSIKHPAIFPEKLAYDHIISWSNPGDIVFDPFMGSGTTGKMALQAGRKFIGCEVVKEYFEMAAKRIETC